MLFWAKKHFVSKVLLFISSVTNQGLTELKDLLWKVLNTPVE